MKLDKVTKVGNEIVILYKTNLDVNSLNMNNGVLRISIKGGVSDNNTVNHLLCNICRYINE